MKALSIDLRERIVAAHTAEPELIQQALAKRFLISQATVSNILAKDTNNESLEPAKQPGHPRKLSESDMTFLEEFTTQKNDRTLEEYVAELEKREVKVSDSTVYRELQRLKQTRKKNSPRSDQRHRRKPTGPGRIQRMVKKASDTRVTVFR